MSKVDGALLSNCRTPRRRDGAAHPTKAANKRIASVTSTSVTPRSRRVIAAQLVMSSGVSGAPSAPADERS
ncbi:MAG: hypothetical protein IPH91_00030 [Elusimicrobia bacterium]|nr:hypothetical protein [Elusimicrobiota bacterium]